MLEITKRQGLVVWVYSLKQIKALRHYGSVLYVSKRMKYVYLYLDADQIPAAVAKLTKLRFVKAVEPSAQPLLETTYGGQSSLAALEDDEDDDAPKGGPNAHH
ncbi:YlbG family protein [Lacticaseibacillus daqingensis]|uniref:YlbG family protein n=1 Tax=Lacticaseibacillus daqingensis TaxID=2486014 RepID=UPI000F780AA5|nr:YlbG family protein [Lacticaseibacillus daqingensis]